MHKINEYRTLSQVPNSNSNKHYDLLSRGSCIISLLLISLARDSTVAFSNYDLLRSPSIGRFKAVVTIIANNFCMGVFSPEMRDKIWNRKPGFKARQALHKYLHLGASILDGWFKSFPDLTKI